MTGLLEIFFGLTGFSAGEVAELGDVELDAVDSVVYEDAGDEESAGVDEEDEDDEDELGDIWISSKKPFSRDDWFIELSKAEVEVEAELDSGNVLVSVWLKEAWDGICWMMVDDIDINLDVMCELSSDKAERRF